MTAALQRLMPLLVQMQARLDEDLAVARLGQWAGLSPSRLHRLFRQALGETPAAHVERLRLERAALRLHLHDERLLDLALDSGYASHETFTRAFRRRFGEVPSRWRASAVAQRQAREARSSAGAGFALSATRLTRLRPLHLAFIRHHGPYEDVPLSLFDALYDWARRRRLPGPWLWLGIGHDAPGITAPQQLRFDAALAVPAPFAPQGRIGCQALPALDVALTTHAGGLDTLPQAYATVFERLRAMRGLRLVGLPVVEVYRGVEARPGLRWQQTDLCLPVQRLG